MDNTLTGVIATKDKTHIALFFVESKNHNKGIGRMLFNKINDLNEKNYMTVNSSLFAHDIYKHLGFIDTDTEQCIHGIKFLPNEVSKKKRLVRLFRTNLFAIFLNIFFIIIIIFYYFIILIFSIFITSYYIIK